MSTPRIAVHSAEVAAGHNPENSRRVDSRRFLSGIRPKITQVCERIFRDWLRGVTERSLCKMHKLKRPLLEEVLREQAQAMARSLRNVCRVCRSRRGVEDGDAA